MVTYYALTNNELILFCTVFTVIGCVMSMIGLRLAAYPAVRNKVIDLYESVKGHRGA